MSVIRFTTRRRAVLPTVSVPSREADPFSSARLVDALVARVRILANTRPFAARVVEKLVDDLLRQPAEQGGA
jgi:hypothetical protein